MGTNWGTGFSMNAPDDQNTAVCKFMDQVATIKFRQPSLGTRTAGELAVEPKADGVVALCCVRTTDEKLLNDHAWLQSFYGELDTILQSVNKGHQLPDFNNFTHSVKASKHQECYHLSKGGYEALENATMWISKGRLHLQKLPTLHLQCETKTRS